MLLSAILFYLVFLAVSYLIFKFIYRKILKSQKRVSKFLVFLGSIVLIVFYYTPYSFYLEPSYWEFRKICKLNELPNNAEKYNKILGYFDTDLNNVDWEELNQETWKIREDSSLYRKNVFEYETGTNWKLINYRTKIIASFLSNKPEINTHGIKAMQIGAAWRTRRYYPNTKSMASYEIEWKGNKLVCVDIVNYNLKVSDEQQ